MTLPGENTLIIGAEALMRIVQERLNQDVSTRGPIIRVTRIKTDPYGFNFEFSVTTDRLPKSDTITEDHA
jgi:hypothetical protein